MKIKRRDEFIGGVEGGILQILNTHVNNRDLFMPALWLQAHQRKKVNTNTQQQQQR